MLGGRAALRFLSPHCRSQSAGPSGIRCFSSNGPDPAFKGNIREESSNPAFDSSKEQTSAEVGAVPALITQLLSIGIDGTGPLSSSKELVAEYKEMPAPPAAVATNPSTSEKRTSQIVDSMIAWETSKTFGASFVTGLGGLFTLPAALPTAVFSSWVLQARLSGAIAEVYGFDTEDEHIRSLCLCALLGSDNAVHAAFTDAAKEVNPQAMDIPVDAVVKLMTEQATLRFPVQVMLALQQAVGKRLLAHAGARTMTAGARAVPIISGVVGGGIDAMSMQYTAATAKRVFASAAATAAEDAVEAAAVAQEEREKARPTEAQLREEIERLAARGAEARAAQQRAGE